MKNKKVKRLLAILCVLVMLAATFAISAYAWAGKCPNCGKTYNIGTYNGKLPTWTTTRSSNCVHGTSGQDLSQQYTGDIYCNSCNYPYYGTMYRTYCTGTGTAYSVTDEVM